MPLLQILFIVYIIRKHNIEGKMKKMRTLIFTIVLFKTKFVLPTHCNRKLFLQLLALSTEHSFCLFTTVIKLITLKAMKILICRKLETAKAENSFVDNNI